MLFFKIITFSCNKNMIFELKRARKLHNLLILQKKERNFCIFEYMSEVTLVEVELKPVLTS
jgi:hypothetical protein